MIVLALKDIWWPWGGHWAIYVRKVPIHRHEDDTEGEGGAGNMDAADSSHAGHAGNADGDADDGD